MIELGKGPLGFGPLLVLIGTVLLLASSTGLSIGQLPGDIAYILAAPLLSGPAISNAYLHGLYWRWYEVENRAEGASQGFSAGCAA